MTIDELLGTAGREIQRTSGRRRRPWRVLAPVVAVAICVSAAVVAADCTAPTVIAASGGTVTGTTSGASGLTGTCEPDATGGAPEAVFQWMPDVSGPATIETCSGSATTFDTVLYVRAAACTDGPELACNDDTTGCGTTTDPANPHRGSRVTLDVQEGKLYFIVVDGFTGSEGGSSGSFSLTVTPPPIVSTTTSTSTTTTTLTSPCGSPTVIAPAGGTVTGTTSGGSALTGTCEATATGQAPEAVFQWTPDVSGPATIDTCSPSATTFDTVLYVRAGACADGAELACNDDTTGCGTTTDPANPHRGSRVTVDVQAGTPYFIVVDGFGGSEGGLAGTFSLTVTPPATVPTTSTTTSSTSTTATTSSSTSTSTTKTTTSTTRTTTTSTTHPPGMVCGDRVTAPCVVNVDTPAGTFGSLQRAIDAAADGATITVRGLCVGPVRVIDRNDLTIQGTEPVGGCPAGGPAPTTLTSTIRGGRDLVRVWNARNLVLQFLNIVDAELSGVRIANARDAVVHCNCVARNGRVGVRVEDGRRQEISRNLVTQNERDGIALDECRESTVLENTAEQNRGDGISLQDGKRNVIAKNVVRANRDAGINLDQAAVRFFGHGSEGSWNEENTVGENVCEDNEGDGIRLQESDRNAVVENTVRRNAADGIDLEESDRNRVSENQVVDNGTNAFRDSGIELSESDRNLIDANVIRGNADGLVDRARCRFGSHGNAGSNAGPRCR